MHHPLIRTVARRMRPVETRTEREDKSPPRTVLQMSIGMGLIGRVGEEVDQMPIFPELDKVSVP